MIELKIPFLKEEERKVKIFGTAGESTRTLGLDTDFLAMYPYSVEQIFKKSHEDDVAMAKAMMDKLYFGDSWGDDADARDNERARQERQKRYDDSGVY